MAIQKIFRATILSCRFFTRQGIAANFMNGRFTTDNKEVEAELMQEVGEVGRTKSRHPFIFIDETEPELDTEALSPIELIKLQAKEEARKELLAEMAAQNARAMDAGANVSSSFANFADSLNNTAKQQADAVPAAAVTATPSAMQVKLEQMRAQAAAAASNKG